MKRFLIIFGIILGVTCVIGYNYMYQDHRDIAAEEVDFAVEALVLGKEFKENTEEANAKYLNKTIGIHGMVTEVDNGGITLNNLVYCMLSDNSNTPSVDQTLSIKGRCIGYDDLLEVIKLDQVVITNN